ncbi:MAG TPA: hypothetical protein VLG92_05840 [Candidatus Saccharimonadia bacterium]|nr:hypothetical protein [Candidatus Saccharimonadia bacterium]
MKRQRHSQNTPENNVASLAVARRRHELSVEQVLDAYNSQVPALRSEWMRIINLVLTSSPIVSLDLGKERLGYTIPARPTSFSLRDPQDGAVHTYQGTGKVHGVLHPKAFKAQEAVRTLEAIGTHEGVVLHPSSRPLLFDHVVRSTIALCVQKSSPDIPTSAEADGLLYCEVGAPAMIAEKLAENSMGTYGPEGARDYLQKVAAAHFTSMGVIAAVLEPPLPTPPPLALA